MFPLATIINLVVSIINSIAYIPLRRKTIGVGSWRWLRPPTPQFCVRYTNMLVSKNALPPTPNLKFAFHPTQNPNANQWNIGCVGSQTQISRVGHVHFMCISFALGSQFPVEYGLIVTLKCTLLVSETIYSSWLH